jgi:hypothetical protein
VGSADDRLTAPRENTWLTNNPIPAYPGRAGAGPFTKPIMSLGTPLTPDVHRTQALVCRPLTGGRADSAIGNPK